LSFKPVLEELVSKVEGAEGAIFLEVDGEAVEWYAPDNGDRLRLRAAYIAVVLQASRALAGHLNIGTTRQMLLVYEGAKFIIEELGSGYFLALEVSVSTNVAQARYRMEPVVANLRADILS
jgi:predicted regulator of Ras-like GTPase activity (Roadblock/LC7/MglB family)